DYFLFVPFRRLPIGAQQLPVRMILGLGVNHALACNDFRGLGRGRSFRELIAATSDTPMCLTTRRPGVSRGTTPKVCMSCWTTSTWRFVCSRYFSHSSLKSSFSTQVSAAS